MSPHIRLRYSTIVNYISLVYKLIISTGFIIIVARKLSISEFGLWGIILSITTMLATPIYLWSYWAQRFHARGWIEAASTGLIATLVYLVPASTVYLLISLFENIAIGWGFQYFILALPLALLQPPAIYLSSIVAVTKPELSAYTNAISDTLRLTSAYVFVVIFKMGLEGALYSIELATLAGLIYLTIMLAQLGTLKLIFSLKLIKEWLRAFYIPLLVVLTGILRSSIRAIVSLISGSEYPVAYLNIGFSAERPLLQASRAALPALYARSLKEVREEDLEESLRLCLFFTGYLFATFTVLSKTIASLYNPRYSNAYIVIPLIAVYAFFGNISDIYATVLSGWEEIDAAGIPGHKKLLSSMIFRVPLAMLGAFTLSYILFTIPISLSYFNNPINIAILVASSLVLSSFILLIYLWSKIRAILTRTFPRKEATAIIVAAAVVSIYYVFSGAAMMEIVSFWKQLPMLLLHLLLGLIIYVVTAYFLSPWVRKLIKDSFKFLFE